MKRITHKPRSRSISLPSPSKVLCHQRYFFGCNNNHVNSIEFLHKAWVFHKIFSRSFQGPFVALHMIKSKYLICDLLQTNYFSYNLDIKGTIILGCTNMLISKNIWNNTKITLIIPCYLATPKHCSLYPSHPWKNQRINVLVNRICN